MRTFVLMVQAGVLVALLFTGLPAVAQLHDDAAALRLVQVGDDCAFSTDIYNAHLTPAQIRSSRARNPRTEFTFVTDLCDDQRILIGVFGEMREMTRVGNPGLLQDGGTYSNGDVTVQVVLGERRWHQACEFVDPENASASDDYFDVTVIVERGTTKGTVFGTLLLVGCP